MNKKQKRKELKEYYMVEQIRPERFDNMSISWDSDQFDPTPEKGKAIILYTQDMEDKSDHSHIELTDNQALKLRESEEKVKRLTDRGIEDMKHEISELREKLREVEEYKVMWQSIAGKANLQGLVDRLAIATEAATWSIEIVMDSHFKMEPEYIKAKEYLTKIKAP